MAEDRPAKIGKYQIVGVLGKGAMGIVYKAFDPLIERFVAIKTVHKELIEGDDRAEGRQRFVREAQAAGRLNHRNIVSVYEFGGEGDVSFIAMEFVEGRSLKDYFDANERFTTPAIVEIMSQLLGALEYSHDRGVVHRDIKPANILIVKSANNDDIVVKISDFGIARIESSTMTQVGTVLGTPSYMSPEQFLGQPVDRRSDIYSAAMVLYQFLTGEKAYSGSMSAIMNKVLNSSFDPPSMHNVLIPRAMDAVVMKAAAKRPEDRYQTAKQFADAIEAAFAGDAADPDAGDEATVVLNARDTAANAARPAATRPPTAPASATPSIRHERPARSRLPWLAGGAVVAVALVAGGTYLLTSKAPDVGAAGTPGPVVRSPAGPVATEIARGAAATATSQPAVSPEPAPPRVAPEPKPLPAPQPQAAAGAEDKGGKEPTTKDIIASLQTRPPAPAQAAAAPQPQAAPAARPAPAPSPQAAPAPAQAAAAPQPQAAAGAEDKGGKEPTTAEIIASLQTRPPAPPPVERESLRLSLTTNLGTSPRLRIKAGAKVVLKAVATRDAFLYCFYEQANGQIMRLFPNRFVTSAELAPNQTLEIPSESMAFDIAPEPPQEKFQCFATTRDPAALLPSEIRDRDLAPLSVRSTSELDRIFGSLPGVGAVSATVILAVE